MLDLIAEAIRYLCVLWFVTYGFWLYAECTVTLITGRSYRFDSIDLLNGCFTFYLVLAGLPKLGILL